MLVTATTDCCISMSATAAKAIPQHLDVEHPPIFKYVPDIKIDSEFKALIPPLAPEEYTLLEQNLIKETNPDSIVLITWNSTLIDGHNRYEMCQKHNIPFRTVEKNGFADRDEVKEWIIKNQFGRRNISNFTRVELAAKLESLIRKKALQNKQEASRQSIEVLNQVSQKSVEPEITEFKKVDTQKELAKIAGLSHDTVHKGLVVLDKATPETKDKLRNKTLSINEVYNEIKKAEKQEARTEKIERLRLEIEQSPEPLDGLYDVVVVDPPWEVNWGDYDPINRRGVPPYPMISVEELNQLKIPASENCILFFWVINNFIHEGFHIIEKWGFQVKNMFTWVKDKFGLGDWGRGQTEHVFVCVKGKPVVDFSSQPTVIYGIRREHSRKPDEFYAMVERTCIGRKLDYFSREKRRGWAQCGNEPAKFPTISTKYTGATVC